MHKGNSGWPFKPTREIVLGAEDPFIAVLHRPPRVVQAIIALNVLVYLVTSMPTMFTSTTSEWIARLGFVPAELLADPRSAYRILLAMFTHADILHIFFNMYFLYIFGRAVERALGGSRFLALYLGSGVLAAVFHTIFTYLQSPAMLAVPSVGASGAISGVLGAYMLLFPGTRLTACFFMFFFPLCFEMTAAYYLLLWFAFQVIEGYVAFNSSVAFFAHAGGFLAGIALLPLVADERRLRALRLLSRAERSLFGILYFPEYTQHGLSPQTKMVFSLLAGILIVGTVVSYASSTTTTTILAAYNVDWRLASGDHGIDRVFVYISEHTITPVPEAAASTPARIVVRTLWDYNIFYNPSAAMKEIAYTELPAKRVYILYTLYRKLPILVQPIAVRAEYDETGLLAKAHVDIYIRSILARDEIVSVVQRVSMSDASKLLAYMAIASFAASIAALYTILYRDTDYVIKPEF